MLKILSHSIKQASDPHTAHYAAPVHEESYTILIIQPIMGFPYKNVTIFVISTVRQKGCSQENFLLHC